MFMDETGAICFPRHRRRGPRYAYLESVTYIGNTTAIGPVYWKTVWKFSQSVLATPHAVQFGGDFLSVIGENDYFVGATTVSQFSATELICTHLPGGSPNIPPINYWVLGNPRDIVFPGSIFVPVDHLPDEMGSGPIIQGV